jgi:prepilin-type N-terminal cleavage/methylation domain-containing protein
LKKHKGFMLLEILLVLVLIAILAALIIPRYVIQIENACLAEASQMLGALLRAYQVSIDTDSNPPALTDATNASQMAALGLKALPSSGAKFVYSCTDGGTSCTATRIIG